MSLSAGTYRVAQTLTITQADDIDIYYTLDGSDPSDSSIEYSDPIVLDANGAYTVKAIAVDSGLLSSKESKVATADYIIDISSVSGAIAVGTGVAIANVKVGLFLQDTADQNICENIANRATAGGRVYLNDSIAGASAGDLEELAPVASGEIDAANNTYELDFPDIGTIASGAQYYLIAWYDADSDGKLDLYREDSDTILTTGFAWFDDGEYNRLAVKTVDIGGAATSSFVSYLEASDSTADTYSFKYYDVTNDQSYATIDLDPSAGSEFDFAISATVDAN